MSSFTYFRALVCVSGALLMLVPAPAEAQIVRRYAGGGVAVRAPFVRVDVGPYGETSVRAPFVAVDDPGNVYVGPRGRLRSRPMYAGPPPGYYAAPGAAQPTPARPLPTPEELAVMELPELVQVLRDLDATLMYELSRFDKAAGWQKYLALPADALGRPDDAELSIRVDVLQKQRTRFDKVASDNEFAKIAASPSFPATHEALRLVVERFTSGGPVMTPPQGDEYPQDPGPVIEERDGELLPSPPPSPEPPRPQRSGERSIIKK